MASFLAVLIISIMSFPRRERIVAWKESASIAWLSEERDAEAAASVTHWPCSSPRGHVPDTA